MAKKNLFKFNIKNLKYSFAAEAPVDLAFANSLALEADYDETVLYGDGQKLAILTDDKGKTGTLSVTNIEELYEIACGRAMLVQGGLGDIQQLESKEHALYYEVEGSLDGKRITIKNWLFGCITGKAGESYEQTTDNPTVNNFEYPLTVLGTTLQDEAGTADYKDADGNTIKCFRITSYPEDADYATFEATVPAAKQPDVVV